MDSCLMVGEGSVVGGKKVGRPLVLKMSALILLGSPGVPQVTGRLREQTLFRVLRGWAAALLALFAMSPPASPRHRHDYHPHFIGEETEARGRRVIVVDTVGVLDDPPF